MRVYSPAVWQNPEVRQLVSPVGSCPPTCLRYFGLPLRPPTICSGVPGRPHNLTCFTTRGQRLFQLIHMKIAWLDHLRRDTWRRQVGESPGS